MTLRNVSTLWLVLFSISTQAQTPFGLEQDIELARSLGKSCLAPEWRPDIGETWKGRRGSDPSISLVDAELGLNGAVSKFRFSFEMAEDGKSLRLKVEDEFSSQANLYQRAKSEELSQLIFTRDAGPKQKFGWKFTLRSGEVQVAFFEDNQNPDRGGGSSSHIFDRCK